MRFLLAGFVLTLHVAVLLGLVSVCFGCLRVSGGGSIDRFRDTISGLLASDTVLVQVVMLG